MPIHPGRRNADSQQPPSGLVGVLTGGCSRERVGSLLSGHSVTQALTNMGLPILVIDTAEPAFTDDVHKIDVAFLAIHGCHAEDGKLQGFLETIGIAYTGSGVLASALAMHKPTAKAVVQAAGVPVLPGMSVDHPRGPDIEARAILDEIAVPLMVKPASEGGSVGMAVAHNTSELEDLLAAAAAHDVELLVEPFIAGARSVTVGLLEMDGQLTALPALETVATEGEFYDTAAKRDPAGIPYDELVTHILATAKRRRRYIP